MEDLLSPLMWLLSRPWALGVWSQPHVGTIWAWIIAVLAWSILLGGIGWLWTVLNDDDE